MDALVDTGAIGSTHTAAARRLLTFDNDGAVHRGDNSGLLNLLQALVVATAAPGDAAAAQ
jgi:hypothetical protein